MNPGWAAWLSRWLPVLGFGVTVVGFVDPLEGFPVVLIGGVLTLMAAIQTRSRYTRLVAAGLGLAVAGCAAMIVLSLAGGVGGNSGRSMWWLTTVAPYPVGALAIVAGGILILRARSREANAVGR